MEFNKRVALRRHLIFYLEVYDVKTNELIGRLVDLTNGGFMLVSNYQLPVGELRDIKIVVPETAEPPFYSFIVKVRAQWSSRDKNPRYYKTGFSFVSISEKEIEQIEGIIEKFAFSDAPVVMPGESKTY